MAEGCFFWQAARGRKVPLPTTSSQPTQPTCQGQGSRLSESYDQIWLEPSLRFTTEENRWKDQANHRQFAFNTQSTVFISNAMSKLISCGVTYLLPTVPFNLIQRGKRPNIISRTFLFVIERKFVKQVKVAGQKIITKQTHLDPDPTPWPPV